MSNVPPFEEHEREELVAYLDDELDEELSRKVEARLQTSPEARSEAESLRKTWDLLDFLPRAEPSTSFTQRTLDRIKPVTASLAPSRKRLWRAAGLGVLWAAGLVLFALIGFFGYRFLRPVEPGDQELVRNLRLIENKHLYEMVEDLDFLKALDQPDFFGEEQGS